MVSLFAIDKINPLQSCHELQLAFGDNNYEYYLHYVKYGRNEGRVVDRRIAVTLNPMGGEVSEPEFTVTDYAPYGTLPLAAE